MKNKFKTYIYRGITGVTDLKDVSPYNEYGDYVGSIPEKDYLSDPKVYRDRLIKENKEYIKQLKAKGTYKEEYSMNITMMYNPLFDDNVITTSPMSSHRLIFLDNKEYER